MLPLKRQCGSHFSPLAYGLAAYHPFQTVYFFKTHMGLPLGEILVHEVVFIALQVKTVRFCFAQITSV